MKFLTPLIATLTFATLAMFPTPLRAAEIVESDVCVYGGTSGGVTAAVQAARMGKSVVLVVFNNHLGGMSSGGLGWTDYGNKDSIHGLAREYYIRIRKKYTPSSDEPMWTWEPKVAEAVFNDFVQEAGIPVYWNQRLAGAEMDGNRITSITMEDGTVFKAKMFIDCTYEGDLMAKAGVTYTIGREPNSQYGETINGIQAGRTGNQLPDGIDPYVVPGDPSSGLLPGVNPNAGGPNGAGDGRVQAYNYRMCLTDDPANRIMVQKPEGYDEKDYEILFRAIEAGQKDKFWKTDMMPNRKTDSNNASGISTDFIGGGSEEWAEASYERREEIARAHEKWQRGLIWTVQNHPRVPASIRSAWSKWGLPADEFLDTNHWPHQLYVREARRMVSDYVMTQLNCTGERVAPESIALASYMMDSHHVQRIVWNGMVKNEGDVQVKFANPYPISYRSIIPARGECENLFVTFAISASHMGFGSCRMEPVFMMTSQSAATAAAFAIDDNLAVQDVPYPKLKAQLLAQGQMPDWATVPEEGIVIDNAATDGTVTVTGEWTTASSTAGYYGSNYMHDANTGKGTKSVRFQPNLPKSGVYEVFAWWVAHDYRPTNVPIDITHAGGTTTVFVNQKANGSKWVSLGKFPFNAGSAGSVTIRTTGTAGTNQYVIADAVQFLPESLPRVSIWATNAIGSEPVNGAAARPRFTISRTGSTTSPLVVNLSIGGTALNGSDYATFTSTVTIPAGASSREFELTPLADDLYEGEETITIGLNAPAGYEVNPELSVATLRILDANAAPPPPTPTPPPDPTPTPPPDPTPTPPQNPTPTPEPTPTPTPEPTPNPTPVPEPNRPTRWEDSKTTVTPAGKKLRLVFAVSDPDGIKKIVVKIKKDTFKVRPKGRNFQTKLPLDAKKAVVTVTDGKGKKSVKRINLRKAARKTARAKQAGRGS